MSAPRAVMRAPLWDVPLMVTGWPSGLSCIRYRLRLAGAPGPLVRAMGTSGVLPEEFGLDAKAVAVDAKAITPPLGAQAGSLSSVGPSVSMPGGLVLPPAPPMGLAPLVEVNRKYR